MPATETAPAKFTTGQKFDFKPGDPVICNGVEAMITKVCDGQLSGMVEARVPGGTVCVSDSYPDVYPR